MKKFVPAITVLFLCSLSFAETPAAAKVNPQQEAPAQDGHSHMLTPQQQELTADQQSKASALLQKVREATERFKDVAQAEREHYSLLFGCVSGPDAGAMGLHFLNGDLLNEVNNGGVFDPTRPQIVLYEPTSDGRLRLVGADFLVFADAWDAKHPHDPPQLMGQLFHFVRHSESLRAPGVLHAACLGVEGESQRRVRELAPQRFLPGIQGPKSLSRGDKSDLE